MKHIQKKINKNISKKIPIKHIKTTKKVVSKTKTLIRDNMQSPLINIITRTSGRPNGFKRCHQSIKSQTYKNIRHVVSIDDFKDKEYVEACGVTPIFIDKQKIISLPDIPNPNTGKRFIYNLYFNVLFSKVNSGWILILDDDDFLANEHVVQEMVNNINNNNDMLIWKMRYPNGQMLPRQMNIRPRLGTIGSPCIMIHSSVAKGIKWDGWKCGDYRYISKAWNSTETKVWIDSPLIQLGGAGFGLKKDIAKEIKKTEENNKKPKNEKKTPKNEKKKSTNRNINKKNNILNNFKKKYKNGSNKVSKIDIAKTPKKAIIKARPKVKPLTKNEPVVKYIQTPQNKRKKVSILITAFNTSKYIEACLNSIETQLYFKDNDKFEVIVGVDACQKTYQKLLKIKDKYRNLTIVMMAENRGTYITMNTLLKMAKYDNIIRFDSDDVMKGHMVSRIMSVSDKADIVRFRFTVFRHNVSKTVARESGRMPAVGVLFYKRKVIDMAGGYVNSRFSADSELIMRTLKFTKTIELPDQLFFYRRHGSSLSDTVSKVKRKKFDDKTRRTIYTKNNLKITPVINKILKMDRSKKFNQEIKYFIEKIRKNIPFSIVRYGDGEMMIIENKPIDLTKKFNGEHKFNPSNAKYQKLRNEMTASIRYSDESYFVGLPCPCCVPKENVNKIMKVSQQKEKQLTWANIFVNSNFKIFNNSFFEVIKNKDIVLVCHENAETDNFSKDYNVIKEFRVGANAWYNDYDNIEEILEYSKTVNPNTVFLFMAGTFTKLTIYKIHQERKDLFLLDLGSTMDLKLGLGATRNYLNKNSKNSNKVCRWLTQ